MILRHAGCSPPVTLCSMSSHSRFVPLSHRRHSRRLLARTIQLPSWLLTPCKFACLAAQSLPRHRGHHDVVVLRSVQRRCLLRCLSQPPQLERRRRSIR
jgi:hypothetical protein